MNQYQKEVILSCSASLISSLIIIAILLASLHPIESVSKTDGMVYFYINGTLDNSLTLNLGHSEVQDFCRNKNISACRDWFIGCEAVNCECHYVNETEFENDKNLTKYLLKRLGAVG